MSWFFYEDNPPNLRVFDSIDFIVDRVDRVSYSFLREFPYPLQSLYLIRVEGVRVYKRGSQTMRRRAVFEYKGIEYDLPLTDPMFKELKDDILEDKYLCVSLGEPFYGDSSDDGFCYKIVAAII